MFPDTTPGSTADLLPSGSSSKFKVSGSQQIKDYGASQPEAQGVYEYTLSKVYTTSGSREDRDTG